MKFVIALFVLGLVFYMFLVGRIFVALIPLVRKHVDFKELWDAKSFGLEAEHFFVQTEDGLSISAYEVQADDPKGVVICLSGIHNPSVTAYFGHARLFKEYGYATILFDMRAHGESDGDKIYMGYKEFLDTEAIVKYIKKMPYYQNKPIVVMGLSMGAATAINSIGKIAEIDGLVTLSAYSSFEEVFRDRFLKRFPGMLSIPAIPFIRLGTIVNYGFDYRIKPKKEIEKLGKRPALLIHSTEDSEVPFLSFQRILDHAPSHVETLVVDGDKHLILDDFTKPEEDLEYGSTLIGFLEHHFGKTTKNRNLNR